MLSDDFINNELPALLNIFLLNGCIIKDKEYKREYDLLISNFKDINKFVYDNFGVSFYKSRDNRVVKLNKLSGVNALGFKDKVNPDMTRMLFLVLSYLAKFNVGDSIVWANVEDESASLYKAMFDKNLSVYRSGSIYKNIREFLTNDNISILKEIDNEDDQYLYCLNQEVSPDSIKNINIEYEDNYFKEAKSFLLFNGCVNRSNNEKLFEALKNNTNNCFYFTQKFFDKLKGDNGKGYYLMDFDDSYMLIYRGYDIFPRLKTNIGVFFIELISKIDSSSSYDFDDLTEIAKETKAYKQRAGLRDSLNSNLREVLGNMIYYGFMRKEVDGEKELYIPNESVRFIESDYMDTEQLGMDEVIYG